MLKNRFKKLFVPHEENGYKPDFLERFSIGVMMVLVIISFAIANIQALVWMSSEWMVTAVLPSVIVNLTNEEREEGVLVDLKRNKLLDEAAQMKADDMAKKGYFAHYSPDGTSPWYWFEQVSYDYTKAGENLAVHFNDSGKVVDAWMKSPSHRANIMNGAYTEIGIGTARGEYKGSKTVFVVQLFGTPNVANTVTNTTVTNTVVSNIETSSTSSAPQLAFAEEITDDILGEETVEIEVPATVPLEIEIKQTNQEALTLEGESIEEPDVIEDETKTSRDVVPAILDVDGGVPPSLGSAVENISVSSIAKTVTQPSVWLQMVYAVLAIIVVIALIMSVVIEWRKQNPLQLAYAGSLLAVMALLFHVHTTLTSGVTII